MRQKVLYVRIVIVIIIVIIIIIIIVFVIICKKNTACITRPLLLDGYDNS